MKYLLLFIFTILFLCKTQYSLGQKTQENFYFKYCEIGLGSNRGLSLPLIEIQNNILTYTLNQNSPSYFEDTSITDTLLIKNIRQFSIDSIKIIAEPFLDSTIRENNFCITSGSLHYIKLSYDSNTTVFYLQNTFHRKVLPIMKIINSYIPENKQLLFTEEYIRKSEDCFERWYKQENQDE